MVVIIRRRWGTACWEAPVAIPAAQEYFYVGGETEVFDVAGETLPPDETAIERVLDVICVARVHPVEELVDGGRIWDWEEENGMGGWRGQEAR